MAKRRTKMCTCKHDFYIEDSETLCDYCLVEKFGLGSAHPSELVGGADYYEEADVIKALRKASGL